MMYKTFSGKTMGTTYSVKIADTFKEPAELDKAIAEILGGIDAKMSTYKPDSEVCRFNAFRQSGISFPVSQETAEAVQAALEVSRQTNGAFDITVAPLVDLWGFGPKTVNKPLHILAAESAKIKERIGYQKLSVHKETQVIPAASFALKKSQADLTIDLSAIAKGYGVDKVAEYLDGKGYKNYMIEVGGEIRCRGKKTAAADWLIGIEKPVVSAGTDGVQRTFVLRDRSMATSGDYRQERFIDGKRVSHFIDPRTGLPTQFGTDSLEVLASVTVFAGDCMTADAWATALSVLGVQHTPEALQLNVLYLFRQGNSIREVQTGNF
ncbi:MAG: FAD:protein FMN transferase [Planctomycetaceae bacterium]|jgi:thiamine biosynthesis lipoprotein|nr:FAD:protein FMN transferase [Planctomycetaceae bacterium]